MNWQWDSLTKRVLQSPRLTLFLLQATPRPGNTLKTPVLPLAHPILAPQNPQRRIRIEFPLTRGDINITTTPSQHLFAEPIFTVYRRCPLFCPSLLTSHIAFLRAIVICADVKCPNTTLSGALSPSPWLWCISTLSWKHPLWKRNSELWEIPWRFLAK